MRTVMVTGDAPATAAIVAHAVGLDVGARIAGYLPFRDRGRAPVWSGALAAIRLRTTCMDRWFKAVDAKSGRALWTYHAPSGFVGQAVTFAYLSVRSVVPTIPHVEKHFTGSEFRP